MIIGITMSRSSLLGILFCVFLTLSVDGQRMSSGGLEFVEHLEKIEAYSECALFLRKYEEVYGASDTTNLYQGRMAYFNKQYDQSIGYFSQVSPSNSSYWNQARFYAAWQSANVGKLDQAKSFLNDVNLVGQGASSLQILQLAGVSLLEKDLRTYESLSSDLNSIGFDYQKNVDAFDFVYDRLKNRKKKSPFLAGLFSAIVPGAGKMYQGKVAEGTMALAVSAIIGSQAYEGYRKDGLESARFIIFGSLFSVFYVANIWGSVVSVRVENLHFNQENHETVLLHMHIPIRLQYR